MYHRYLSLTHIMGGQQKTIQMNKYFVNPTKFCWQISHYGLLQKLYFFSQSQPIYFQSNIKIYLQIQLIVSCFAFLNIFEKFCFTNSVILDTRLALYIVLKKRKSKLNCVKCNNEEVKIRPLKQTLIFSLAWVTLWL